MFRYTLRLAIPAMLALTGTPALAQSGTFTDVYIGCATQVHLNQLGAAIHSGDTRLRDAMMGRVCAIVKGYDYSILKRGMLTSKVRVYVGTRTIDLVVQNEALD